MSTYINKISYATAFNKDSNLCNEILRITSEVDLIRVLVQLDLKNEYRLLFQWFYITFVTGFYFNKVSMNSII